MHSEKARDVRGMILCSEAAVSKISWSHLCIDPYLGTYAAFNSINVVSEMRSIVLTGPFLYARY